MATAVSVLRFLSVEEVLQIQEDTLGIEGGLRGVRDVGLLESAVLMPQQQFGGVYLHDGIGAMAAAYLFHIASNHPFLDGNKRAGAMSALIFLDVNGIVSLPEPDALEAVTMAVASGQMDKVTLTEWFRVQIGEGNSDRPFTPEGNDNA